MTKHLYRPIGDLVEQTKNILFSKTRSATKILELLHLQLLRKARAFDKIRGALPNGEEAYFYLRYDIKTPSRNPYNKDSGYDLGLNQLFVGQNPYKPYNGNPKDGIYHDTVNIVTNQRSSIPGITLKQSIYEWTQTSSIVNNDGYEVGTEVKIIATRKDYAGYVYKGKTYNFNDPIMQNSWTEIKRIYPIDSGGYAWFLDCGYALVYAPPHVTGKGGDNGMGYEYHDAIVFFMPIFYEKNNHPVMSVRTWVDEWSKNYTLIIKEDKGLGILAPIGAIIIMVAAVMTAGAASVAASSATSAVASASASAFGIAAGSGIVGIATALGIGLSAISVGVALMGIGSNSQRGMRLGKKIGIIGVVFSLGASINAFFSSGAKTAAASTLPSQTISASGGTGATATTTASLYNGVAVQSWAVGGSTSATSAAGSNLSSSVLNSGTKEVASQFGQKSVMHMSFSEALHANVFARSQNWLTRALDIVGIGAKGFGLIKDINGAFRQSNNYVDEDMVDNSQKGEYENYSSLDEIEENSDVIVRKFYTIEDEYDIGLEPGTLMSNDDTLLR
ncbi:hypothetical protein CCAL9344_07940 [Campylobacter sp. RM9344]|uniref:Uncharacterized protein n=1 Tax=Campylobacter californiensis TaxID=1032243 RepID=A0AAW3ZVQ8_9BACT|nr:hypothetical protein [Campylobacter sp. RM9337]MBE3030108.1 hypothetical protein [Campylobacter sp. RM9344]MBE3608772.1 hypothetical protein [Campylobacter sp. RM9337]